MLVKKIFENANSLLLAVAVFFVIGYNSKSAMFYLKIFSVIALLAYLLAFTFSSKDFKELAKSISRVKKSRFFNDLVLLGVFITFLINQEYVFATFIASGKLTQLYFISKLEKQLDVLKSNP